LSFATVTTLFELFFRVFSTIRIVLRVGEGFALLEFSASAISLSPIDLQQTLHFAF
jgi:hypothetical protein